jgi:Kelch motif protein
MPVCWYDLRDAAVVFVILGTTFAPSAMRSVALAQGDPGSWSAASTMPTGTGDSGVAALDGKIYVVGGSSFYPHILPTSSDMGSGTWGSSVNYEYDPATDKCANSRRCRSD